MQENKNASLPEKKSSESGVISAFGAFIFDLAKIVVFAMVIILPFRFFVAEPFVVSGSSMVPNFHDRDYLIVDRLSYRMGEPKRGDVIVLKFPKDTSQYFIKRIIGLPGDTIEIQQGFVTIFNQQHPDGFRLNEPYLTNQSSTLGRVEKLTLGSGEYYVLGDNRTGSSDSRVWGILPANDIVGRVWVRVLPAKDMGFIARQNY